MGEYAVDSSSYGSQSLYRALADGDTTVKVFVTVEEAGGSVECVQCVVQRRTLFRFPVSSTEKYPLFRRLHLGTDDRITLILESDGHVVQLQAELSQVLVFPYRQVVVALRRFQNGVHVSVVLPYHVLYVLLNCGISTNGAVETN